MAVTIASPILSDHKHKGGDMTDSRFILRLLALSVVCTLLAPAWQFSAPEALAATTGDSTEHDPVIALLRNYKIKLGKVAAQVNERTKMYYVDLPYDPMTSENTDYYHELFYKVLEANHYEDYSLNDLTDGIIIFVHWQSSSNKMTIEYEEAP